MTDLRFSEQEIQDFLSCFQRVPGWLGWDRRDEDGRDVIRVRIGDDRDSDLRLAKTASGTFVAQGFDCWGLMVCRAFDDLLRSLAGDIPAKAA